VRILLVTNQFVPVVGGIENFLRDYVPALRERGHDVAVLTSRHASASDAHGEHAGARVFRSDLERALSERDVARVHRGRRWIERIEADWAPDVVHAHDAGANLWAHLRSTARAPTIVTIQTSMRGILDPAAFPVALRLLEACEWVTGVSRAVLDELLELLPELRPRSSVVPNAVKLPQSPPVPPPARPHVLCLGRLVRQKGFDVAIDALPELLARVPGVRMTVAGDGRERPVLETQAHALGVRDQIDFTGVVRHRDVAALIDRATAVAMPSRFEGLPLVWLEAAARSRPVVSTAVHGLGELVAPGRNGITVPPDDAAALAAALHDVLTDPELARRLGGAAHDDVVARYSMTACVDAYTALYETVLDGRPAAVR
jgi:glycogen(starch) synthase